MNKNIIIEFFEKEIKKYNPEEISEERADISITLQILKKLKSENMEDVIYELETNIKKQRNISTQDLMESLSGGSKVEDEIAFISKNRITLATMQKYFNS